MYASLSNILPHSQCRTLSDNGQCLPSTLYAAIESPVGFQDVTSSPFLCRISIDFDSALSCRPLMHLLLLHQVLVQNIPLVRSHPFEDIVAIQMSPPRCSVDVPMSLESWPD